MKNFKTSQELANMFSQKLDSLIKFNDTNSGGKILSIFDTWEKIIPNSKLSLNTELFDIKNGIAIIKVNHSGWSQQIMMYKRTILKNFDKYYPELKIKNISVVVESEFLYPKKENYSKRYIPTAEEIKEIEEFDKKYAIEKKLPPELKKALKALKKSIINRK